MTTAEPKPAATATPPGPGPIGFTVDPWDPGYAVALTVEALTELDATTAELNLDIELSADRWQALTADPATVLPSVLLVADGVRRIDARVWIDNPDGGMPTPGIATSYASGLVRCDRHDGALAGVAGVEVQRALFSPSPHAPDIAASAGAYPARPAVNGTPEQLSLALQQQLTELEVALAVGYRAATAVGDDLLLVDGPLRGRTHLPRTVGYVKTHQTAYLSGLQATVVSALRPAERTPVFLMGTSWRRHSWYLRLPTPSTAPWAGIVRCEASADLPNQAVRKLADVTALLLPPLAGVEYKDPRAPQNLVPIGGLEKLLRHRLGDTRLLYRALRAAAMRDRATPS